MCLICVISKYLKSSNVGTKKRYSGNSIRFSELHYLLVFATISQKQYILFVFCCKMNYPQKKKYKIFFSIFLFKSLSLSPYHFYIIYKLSCFYSYLCMIQNFFTHKVFKCWARFFTNFKITENYSFF